MHENDNCIPAPSAHIISMTHTADLTRIETLARQTVADFPAPFRQAALAVILQVVERPDHDMLQELGIEDPLDLTGLYEGVPMTLKSVSDQPQGPDIVWLFAEPILAEWRERGNVTLEELVAHVTTHEFAHHFGWSDDDIASIDRWWE